jgi:hypothetical protein
MVISKENSSSCDNFEQLYLWQLESKKIKGMLLCSNQTHKFSKRNNFSIFQKKCIFKINISIVGTLYKRILIWPPSILFSLNDQV